MNASDVLTRMDANDLAFIERSLEEVRAKSYDVKYPELKARTLVPVDNTVNPGAETVKYNQYDMVSVAKLLSSYAQDLPRSDVKVKEFRAAIKPMGNSYGYTLQELRNASFAGVPLEARKANAARRGFEELVDKIGAVGDSANSLQGLLAITNAQTFSPAVKDGGGGHTAWSYATGLQMLADLTGISVLSVSTTRGIEVPDTIVIPITQYNLIATTPLFPSGNNVTVLAHFLQTSPYIKRVVSWYRMTGAGSGATDRMLCYRQDADALQLVIPQEFEQLPPQQRGLEWVVPCHGRIAGVVCYYPLSVVYGDGI